MIKNIVFALVAVALSLWIVDLIVDAVDHRLNYMEEIGHERSNSYTDVKPTLLPDEH